MFNRYYVATRDFEALMITKHEPSNTWIGSSNVLQPIYETINVNQGDEIHDLIGGFFHVESENDVREITLARQTRHIFEKSHGAPSPHTVRLDRMIQDETLQEIDNPTKPANGYRPK